MLQCVILAGGLGSRMRPETYAVPKALLPVRGKPFAHWQLTWLASQGVDDVVYSVGYLGEDIEAFVGDGREWGMRVRYTHEGDRLLGTAGAIRLAIDESLLNQAFFVLYGDSYVRLDLAKVERTFLSAGLPALMTVFRNSGRWERSNVILEGDRVLKYDKTCRDPPRAMCHVDYGLSVLTEQIIRELVPAREPADLAPLFTALSLDDKLAGYEATERFFEVGSPKGLQDIETFLGSSGQ